MKLKNKIKTLLRNLKSLLEIYDKKGNGDVSPASRASRHLMVVGPTGAGKSLTILLIILLTAFFTTSAQTQPKPIAAAEIPAEIKKSQIAAAEIADSIANNPCKNPFATSGCSEQQRTAYDAKNKQLDEINGRLYELKNNPKKFTNPTPVPTATARIGAAFEAKKAEVDAINAKIKAHPCHNANPFMEGPCTARKKIEYKELGEAYEKASAELTYIEQAPAREMQEAFDKTFAGKWQRIKYEYGMTFFVLVFLALTSLGCYLICKYILFPKIGGGNEYGSAREATAQELLAEKILRKPKTQLEPSELFLGIHDRKGNFAALPPKRASRHLLVLGPTGAGKSLTILAPNIVKSHADESLFINDTKTRRGTTIGDLWLRTSGYRDNSIYLAPMDPERNQLKFNWIPELRANSTRALLWAESVIGNGSGSGGGGVTDHFKDSASALLAAIWLHTAESEFPNPIFAYRILMGPLAELKYTLENSSSFESRLAARQFLDTAEKEASSVLTTTRTANRFMMSREIQQFLWTNEATDFSVLRTRPTSIFYQMRDEDANLLKPLNSLMFTYMLSQIKQMDGLPIKLLLDEFANFGRVPNFEKDITLLREKEISVTACVQTYISQLRGLYGDNAADTIVSNFNNAIVLPGLEYDDAKIVSDQLGTSTAYTVSRSRSATNPFDGSNSLSAHARPLATPAEITTMDETKIIVFRCSEVRPFGLDREHYSYEDSWYKFEEDYQPILIPDDLTDPLALKAREKAADDADADKAKKAKKVRELPPPPAWSVTNEPSDENI